MLQFSLDATRPAFTAGTATSHAADVQHTVEHAGLAPTGISTAGRSSTRRSSSSSIGEALSFPGHYGQNLDALADCLSDLPATALLWEGWSAFARAEPVPFHSALEVLAAHARDESTAPFVVLLRGEGPDLPEVDSLD